MRAMNAPLLAALLLALPLDPEVPRTVPERTAYARTSTCAEVDAFLRALADLPHGERLARDTFGTSEEGRPLTVVRAALPESSEGDARLRVLVNANIHGGEVEGKEAVQELLREIALGEHAELLERLVVWFVPIYNADGNERIDPANRASQNGPDGGVGERANAHGLDLNRDFVKAESSECAALLALLGAHDPHVFVDLHTTNGSYHGYHLTYSPSLSTNVDPVLDAFVRGELLPAVRGATLREHGFSTFDYGNFDAAQDPQVWATYDHRPRFGTNYYGLRNRIGILSEAYSYRDFETRIAATRAFVLETLRALAARADHVAELCAAADAAVVAGHDIRFGYDTALAPPTRRQVLVGTVDRSPLAGGRGARRLARDEARGVTMDVQDAFRSTQSVALPWAWAIAEPTERERALLAAHGVETRVLREPARVAAETFETSAVTRAERPFQGHHEIALEGAWRAGEIVLPAGALVVPARQPLGRLAAQLLEAHSEDSLSTWNVFEERTRAGAYPVVRIPATADLPTSGER